MNRPQVIATDLDGTLLRSDGTVSDYTKEILHRAVKQDLTVILVTARPPRWMHSLADIVGPGGIVLAGNGAFTYDVAAREIVSHRLFDVGLLAELLHDLRRELPDVTLATEGLQGLGREANFVRDADDHDWLVGTVSQIAAEPAGKILVRHPHWHTEELTTHVARVIDGRAEVSHSGAVELTEIAPPGVTKALALSTWCAEQDPRVEAEQVWAFGDMPNDLPMLAWAGTAHAVANAHPEVIDIAHRVVPANDEDGVARTIASLWE